MVHDASDKPSVHADYTKKQNQTNIIVLLIVIAGAVLFYFAFISDDIFSLPGVSLSEGTSEACSVSGLSLSNIRYLEDSHKYAGTLSNSGENRLTGVSINLVHGRGEDENIPLCAAFSQASEKGIYTYSCSQSNLWLRPGESIDFQFTTTRENFNILQVESECGIAAEVQSGDIISSLESSEIMEEYEYDSKEKMIAVSLSACNDPPGTVVVGVSNLGDTESVYDHELSMLITGWGGLRMVDSWSGEPIGQEIEPGKIGMYMFNIREMRLQSLGGPYSAWVNGPVNSYKFFMNC